MDDLTTVKRLNYFDHQFLRADDFSDEQSYHVSLRRMHNRLLHSWGIADGLDVTFKGGSTSVTVASGVAMDNTGREIVLATDQTVELASYAADADLYLTVAYDEQETDATAETGATGNTRTTEQGLFVALTNPPNDPGQQLLLAVVKRTGTEVTGLDLTGRRVAGAAGGSLDVLGLGLRDPNIISTGWVRMRLEAANRAFLQGSLHISSGLGADGDVTIGGALTVTGAITGKAGASVTGDVAVAGRVAVGTTTPLGPLDVRGQGYVGTLGFTAANGKVLPDGSVGMANNLDGPSQWLQVGGITDGGQRRIALVGTRTLVTGSLGIGVVAPVQSLHSSGNAILNTAFVGDVGQGGSWAGFAHAAATSKTTYALLQSADGLNTLLNKKSGGGAIQFRVDNNPVLTVLDNGFLGLGVTPTSTLHVQGNGLVTGTLTVNGNATLSTAFVGDVGHGALWAGFAHSAQANKTGYGLLQSNDGLNTLINKKSGGGAIQLRVDNSAVVTVLDNGFMGLGVSPAAKLHVTGGAIMPAIGNAETAGIQFPSDPGGGGGDRAFMRYFAETGETTKLLIGVDNDADDRLSLWQMGAERLTIYNGCVGVAMQNPAYNLHVTGTGYITNNFGVGGYLYTGTLPGNVQRNPTFTTGEVHVTGVNGGGWSFGNRETPEANVFDNVGGNRWVLYSSGNIARLWTAQTGDRWSIDASGNMTIAGQLRAQGGKWGFVIDSFVNGVDETLEEGDVVVIGEEPATIRAGAGDRIPLTQVDLARKAGDTRVCGIVSEVHGAAVPKTRRKNSAQEMHEFTPEELEDVDTSQVEPGQIGTMVTLGAFGVCKVDAGYGAIAVGDLLTTSETPGHAMKVADPSQTVGAIVGKALGTCARGKGKIPVMVMLQ